MEAAKVEIVHDFRADIARDFDKLTVGRVRTEVWRISLIAAAVLAVSIAASLSVGYRWGRANAEASIHETEGRLVAAFRYGMIGASKWVGLMSWNDINHALDLCRTRPDLAAIQHDRHACNVPLWIEPDQGAPDAVMNDIISRTLQLQEQLRAPEPQGQTGADAGPPPKPGPTPQRVKPSR